ncbi:hypothetical protein CB1_000293006 [Camelus ferus]|nr:hypothetical protein CB1_000293006 [Camelus ferus]
MRMSRGTIGTPRPQSYRSSSSTSDLSSYDHATSGGALPVQLPREPSEGHPSCHPLSPAKSTSSIDQLSHVHSKRGRAYSSFSTSSGVLEYPPPGVSGRERSGSLDTLLLEVAS